MKNDSTILILGGNGRIGSACAQHLRARLPEARVLQLCRQMPADAVQGNYQLFDPFVDDWAGLPACDVLINAVGAIQASPSMPFERVHTGLTALMLQHRAALGHPRIVQVSALGADPMQKVEFLASKGRADALLLAASDTFVVRPSIVCTPGTMLSTRMRQLLRLSRIGFGKLLVPRGFPDTKVQPILPSDLAALVCATCLSPAPPRVVDAVGPSTISFGELLHGMAAVQGRSLKLVPVPREIVEGFVQHFVGVWFPGMLSYEQFQLLFQDNVSDPAPAAGLIGRELQDSWPFWRSEAAGQELDAMPVEQPRLAEA